MILINNKSIKPDGYQMMEIINENFTPFDYTQILPGTISTDDMTFIDNRMFRTGDTISIGNNVE